MIQRKRRQFWWSLRAKPVSGWHVQQFLKIAATISLPHQRYCILDSDVVFFRDFDLSRFEYPNAIPLLTMANAVTAGSAAPFALARDQPSAARAADAAVPGVGLHRTHYILGPADDPRAGPRIEAVTGLDWIEALCKTREFSEYMLYGYFVQNDPASAAVTPSSRAPLRQLLGAADAEQGRTEPLLRSADRNDVAFSIASFSGTPVQHHPRRDRRERRNPRAGRARTLEPAGLAALC